MDAERKSGCIVELPTQAERQNELVFRIVPLVTVQGSFRSLVDSNAIDGRTFMLSCPMTRKIQLQRTD
jgi:hypothetical protein